MNSLYFMKNGDANAVKIGRARDVEVRRGQFMTGNPEALTVVDAVEAEDAQPVETIIHGLWLSRRIRGEFYALTPEETEEAGRQAREIVADYLPLEREAKLLAHAECDSPTRPPTEQECALHRDVLEAREEKNRAVLRCERAENALRVAIGTSEGLEGLVSWVTESPMLLDQAAFKRAHPELHASFCRPVPRRTLRLLWS